MNGMTGKSENGKVSRGGFVDYYADINFCVPNEREKVKTINNLVFRRITQGNLAACWPQWLCKSPTP